MDDDELVARVAAGDDTALRELFGRHAPWLAVRLRTVLPAVIAVTAGSPFGAGLAAITIRGARDGAGGDPPA